MKKIIAANWKMHKLVSEAEEYVNELTKIVNSKNSQTLLFAPFTCLHAIKNKGIEIGAQNLYPASHGAYTGEISADMLKDAGCNWVLIGHSERRHLIGESNEFIAEKADFALNNNLNIVFCIGETLEERDGGKLEEVLKNQLNSLFNKIDKNIEQNRIVIAYEPVWAIGTGKTATSEDIVFSHKVVRNLLTELCPNYKDLFILYGGSVKPDNAKSILGLENVGGLLVGGASLQTKDFALIIAAAD